MAAMEHIPSTILFVLDLSGASGSKSDVASQACLCVCVCVCVCVCLFHVLAYTHNA